MTRIVIPIEALLTVLLSLMTSAMSYAASSDFTPQGIYGDDDRRDLYQISDPLLKKLAESTVAITRTANLEVDANLGMTKLIGLSYGEKYRLCRGETFFDQLSAVQCSGFLVAPDLILTAGHCIFDSTICKDSRIIFGFSIHREGDDPEYVRSDEVYECAGIVAREKDEYGPDWGLIRLNRPVTNHAPLALNRENNLTKGTPLFVIGHPGGVATKIAGGAVVRDVSAPGYFVSNLDTFSCNSGSAVFNAKTGLVEGILVRGGMDFVLDPVRNCQVTKVCAADDCRGEDATKISAVKAL